MSQTKEGALKARDTNIRKFGKNFYAEVGRLGGRASRSGGFASNKIGPDGLTGRQRAKALALKWKADHAS